MTDNDPANFIFWDRAVNNKAEGHQDPRQIRCREDEEAKEAKSRFWIASAPDIDQAGRQCRAEKWHGKERRYYK